MKKILLTALIIAMISYVYVAFDSTGQGNGQLTYDRAAQWATSVNKCPNVKEIVETETGFTIHCNEEFQGLAGVYAKVFHLSYSADPAKPFLID